MNGRRKDYSYLCEKDVPQITPVAHQKLSSNLGLQLTDSEERECDAMILEARRMIRALNDEELRRSPGPISAPLYERARVGSCKHIGRFGHQLF